MFIVIPGISLNRRLLNRDFTVFCVRGIRLSVQRLKELSVRQVTQELEDLSENIIGLVFIRLVVDRRNYSRDFQFPLRINVKISEHAQNFNVFKPRLVYR